MAFLLFLSSGSGGCPQCCLKLLAHMTPQALGPGVILGQNSPGPGHQNTKGKSYLEDTSQQLNTLIEHVMEGHQQPASPPT